LELEKPTEQHDEKSPSTIEVVPTEVEPPANNIMTTVEEASVPTVAEASVLPTRKRSRSSKWSGDLASQGNRQSLSAKDSNQLRVSRPKSLDDNCDKFEKCIEKNPPGDEKLSTEKESQDPKSEIVCLHKKVQIN
jgi:hypothetical protein